MTTQTGSGCQTSDTLAKILNTLNKTHNMSWREIARYVRPVPFGTLAGVAKGDRLPKKWMPYFRHLNPRQRPDLFAYPVKELRTMIVEREDAK